MMAAVLYGKEHLRVEPVAVPTDRKRTTSWFASRLALTCGTDVKVFRRGYHARMIVPPAVFGHELAGDVVAVGEDVTNFTSGSAWWRPIRRPAASVSTASGDWRISARTCCSTTAPTRSTSAFPARIVRAQHVRDSRARRLSGCGAGRAAGLRGARPREPASTPGRYRGGHRPGAHRPDVRANWRSCTAPRDRAWAAARRNWTAPPRMGADELIVAGEHSDPVERGPRDDRRPRRGRRHRSRRQAGNLAAGPSTWCAAAAR